MHSTRAIDLHFWIATIGVVLYIAAMWIAGVMQGLMWRALNSDGTLTYAFIEVGQADLALYATRFAGGVLFLTGMLVMVWNTWNTWKDARASQSGTAGGAGADCRGRLRNAHDHRNDKDREERHSWPS